jgi:hypothetical protein
MPEAESELKERCLHWIAGWTKSSSFTTFERIFIGGMTKDIDLLRT